MLVSSWMRGEKTYVFISQELKLIATKGHLVAIASVNGVFFYIDNFLSNI